MYKKMRFTTANFKHPDYEGKLLLYIGTETGSIKRIDTTMEDSFDITNLKIPEGQLSQSKITSLIWDSEFENTLIIGRTTDVIDSLNVVTRFSEQETKDIKGPIVGLSRYNKTLIVATDEGKLQIVGSSVKDEHIITCGTHFCKMRACEDDKNFVVTGGKNNENSLRVWDVANESCTHISKTVAKDMLNLEIPILENDFRFLNKFTLASCSRHGYVRLYDFRQQRKPIYNFHKEKSDSFSCITTLPSKNKDFILYVGTTTGGMKAFDTRNTKNHVHTYKGFTGGLTDINLDPTGKYLYTTSLDRYVRVYNAETTVMEFQCYVNSKPTQILMDTNYRKPYKSSVEVEDEESEVSEKQQKSPRFEF